MGRYIMHIAGNSDLLPINRFALKIVAAGSVLIYGKALCEATISISINITHKNVKPNIKVIDNGLNSPLFSKYLHCQGM